MEPIVYKPGAYNTPGVYKGAGGVYNGRGVYNDGDSGGGGGANIGGRNYQTVNIGGVVWLSENLDYKFNGCNIGGSGTPTTPNAWYYNNDEYTYGIDGTRKCGLLYNWHAVKYLNDNKSTLCPGWHVPTGDEWDALANEVGGMSTAGTKLKASNVIWAPSWGGTDDFGFGVLPGGYYNGSFIRVVDRGMFWTASDSGSNAYYRRFDTGASMSSTAFGQGSGLSVRLVKD